MKWLNKKTMLAFAALCVMAPWNQAGATTSGTTDMTIQFPEIVRLHYVPQLTLIFTGEDQAFKEDKFEDKMPLADNAEFDAHMTLTQDEDLGDGVLDNVVVKNVWAVRGITKSGQITVNSEIKESKASLGTTSKAIMQNLQVQTSSVSADESIDVDATGLAWSRAVKGDIVFSLEITDVTQSGDHKGIQYTITATATP